MLPQPFNRSSLRKLRADAVIFLLLTVSPGLAAQVWHDSILVNVRKCLAQLASDEDTDGDKRITIEDSHVAGTDRGDKRFWIGAVAGGRFEVAGTYYLSNLLQELKRLEETGCDTAFLKAERIFEKPAEHISRNIRDFYWNNLERRIDEQGLHKILRDEKASVIDGLHYLYVPPSDQLAHDYFVTVRSRHPEWGLTIVTLPEEISPRYVRYLDGHHGILSLALREGQDSRLEGVPFVVPGGRFNEMYGWDSYFIIIGLLNDGYVELAKSIVDNLVYEIRNYGAVLNANRTYYLTRSQPPFLTSMIVEVYKNLPHDKSAKDWLKDVLEAAIEEHNHVWTSGHRLTKTGLSRYFDSGYGVPPEVEPGHFDPVYAFLARRYGEDVRTFESDYRSGKMKVPELDAYFIHDRAMRESGHDTSYRLLDRCADLVTVDLNSLLYKTETDIADLIEREFSGALELKDGSKERATSWRTRAGERRILIQRYLWDKDRGMFFDYDFARGSRTGYVSATTFYPLWAQLATREQASQLVRNALSLLEMPGGIVSSDEESRGPITPEHPLRQWDYPYGWAPHQMLAWRGMMNYGFDAIAGRLAYRWLFTITLNAAQYNGTIAEKYDVVARSHQVFAEYGNIGTKFSYMTREGFGWTDASYQVGLALLPRALRDSLSDLIPPEWIFQNDSRLH